MSSGDEHSSHQANLPQYPNRYLLAVIDSGQESDAAAHALQAAGFAPEDVSVLHGPEGLKAGQAQEQAGGLLVQLCARFWISRVASFASDSRTRSVVAPRMSSFTCDRRSSNSRQRRSSDSIKRTC